MKEEAKQKAIKKTNENVVIGPSIISNNSVGCIAVLKSGPNKGKLCGCKSASGTTFCKRHS